MEELFDGLGFFAHLFEHAAEVVDQILLFVIERGFFLDGVLEGAHGGVVHAALGEALGEITHGRNALVGILLGFLEFADGFANHAGFKIQLAQFEPDAHVGGIFFHPLPAFGQFELGLGRLNFCDLIHMIRGEWI